MGKNSLYVYNIIMISHGQEQSCSGKWPQKHAFETPVSIQNPTFFNKLFFACHFQVELFFVVILVLLL